MEKSKINLLTQNVLEDTDGGVTVSDPPPLTEVGAPHQRPLEKLAIPPSLYTDVFANSILILVLLAFKGTTRLRLYY